MAKITLHEKPIDTVGNLPSVGSSAPNFTLVGTDLAEVSLTDHSGKTIILNIFPSIDTPVCATSVRRFNQEAGSRDNTLVLCISADLPFAHQRFCETEGLKNVVPLSVFRSPDFGKNYGLTISTGPLAGVLARAIVVIDENGQVKYTELVPEITQEPNYEATLAAL